MHTYKKIILVPRLDKTGGIANYYKAIKTYIDHDTLYLYRGRDGNKSQILTLIRDYLTFIFNIIKHKDIELILLNTSLGYGGFFRDGVFFYLIPRKIKTITFFRGWDEAFEDKLKTSTILRLWLQKTFLKSNRIIVLSSKFKSTIKTWGFKNDIITETTLVDENLLSNFDLDKLRTKEDTNRLFKVLYLGNFKKLKGVWQVVRVCEYLNSTFPDKFHFIMAGKGAEYDEIEEYINKNNLPVTLSGYVLDNKKAEVYKNAHIYLFPSEYGEGMPNSVLEAMAFGLPVLTTDVGGIIDFFENERMGFIIKPDNTKEIVDHILTLKKNTELRNTISEYNFEYSKKFYSSNVYKRLSQIMKITIDGN